MYYHYQVAADNFFANLVAEDDSLSTSEIRLPALTSYTRYYWRVRSGNPAGYSNFSNIRYFTTGNSTSIIDNVVPAPIAELFQISPNPFNSTTGIEFRLKDISHPVKLTIYNLKGQIVTILLDGKAKSGVNSFDWDGKNGKGSPVASGIYYCKLETAGFSRTRKMVLMR